MIKKEKYNKSYSNSEKRIIDLLISDKIHLSVPLKSSEEVIWEKLTQKINKSDKKQVTPEINGRFHLKYQIAVAASILILTGIFFLNKINQRTFIAESGKYKTVILPDNSKIILNAQSKLTYRWIRWNNSREVFLTGEAMFNVQKGSWFKVNTNIGNVTVLGTSFNVLSRDNNFKVDCFTGKVKVNLNNKTDFVILTPGLSTKMINPDSLNVPTPFNINETGKWLNGQFYYSNELLDHVFAEIERQFNVKIIATNLGERYYSGSFNNKNLEDALKVICLPMNLKYEFNNKSTIYVTTIK